jgi:Zn-dependent protease
VTNDSPNLLAKRVCAGCSAEIPASFLACPGCDQLVHAETLKTFAAEAESAEIQGETARALAAWRKVLELLPRGAGQHQRVLEKVQALSARVDASPAPIAAPSAPAKPTRSGKYKWFAGLGALGALVAKFKWALLFLLGKGKLLLAGLFQAKTFLSMALALGVYAIAFGWKFAFGLVVSIYIHEMGHVVWLRRYGIPATAPMFVPGFGAYVRLNQRPATAGEDARVGLAGPIWGAAAAMTALVLGVAFERPLLMAVGGFGAYINLFNLLPVWQLDGSRGFAALSHRQRGLAAMALWAVAFAASDGLFWVLAIVATFRAYAKGAAPETGDRPVLLTYIALVVALTIMFAFAKMHLPHGTMM